MKRYSLLWVLTHLWRFHYTDRQVFIFNPIFALGIDEWAPENLRGDFRHGFEFHLFMKWNQAFSPGHAIEFCFNYRRYSLVSREYWEDTGSQWPPDWNAAEKEWEF